jgi:hypothetical protein
VECFVVRQGRRLCAGRVSRIKRITRRKVLALISAAVALPLLLASGPASAAKTPGCTANANKHNGYYDVCSFVPSGNIITYTAKNIFYGAGGGGVIATFDPTCTTSTGFGQIIFADAFRRTFNLPVLGQCLVVEAHSGQITASG